MPLAPNIDLTVSTTENLVPSKTYYIDFDAGRIIGTVDGVDAVEQFIHKTLLTERFQFLIYSAQFGIELSNLKEGNYTEELLESELERVIREGIEWDTRILGTSNYTFKFNSDSIEVSFEVQTVFGNTSVQEVI